MPAYKINFHALALVVACRTCGADVGDPCDAPRLEAGHAHTARQDRAIARMGGPFDCARTCALVVAAVTPEEAA